MARRAARAGARSRWPSRPGPPPAECPPGPPRRRPGAMLPSPPATTSLSAPDAAASSTRRCRSAAPRPRKRAGARRTAPPRSTPPARLPPERPSSASASGRPASSLTPRSCHAPRPNGCPGSRVRNATTAGRGARPPGRASTTWRSGPSALPPPRSELLARAPELEGLLSLLTDPVDAELIGAAPKLRAISNYAVGVDNVDVEAAAARGIPVGNTPDVLTESTADLARGADARHRAAAGRGRGVRAGGRVAYVGAGADAGPRPPRRDRRDRGLRPHRAGGRAAARGLRLRAPDHEQHRGNASERAAPAFRLRDHPLPAHPGDARPDRRRRAAAG